MEDIMGVQNFRELTVWQRSMQLTVEIYKLTSLFPKEEQYALTNQIRRATVSIPSNIAEGQARQSTAEFLKFLSIASGSLAEVETQMELAIMLNYLTQQDTMFACQLCNEIRRMLAGLKSTLKIKLLEAHEK